VFQLFIAYSRKKLHRRWPKSVRGIFSSKHPVDIPEWHHVERSSVVSSAHRRNYHRRSEPPPKFLHQTVNLQFPPLSISAPTAVVRGRFMGSTPPLRDHFKKYQSWVSLFTLHHSKPMMIYRVSSKTTYAVSGGALNFSHSSSLLPLPILNHPKALSAPIQ